ncbi:MAG TPA: ABC transporter substrate-binding protein [Verrucomicrobiae bacterium]|jgi:ABC-type nitrate/sulfonate/bicarbonate transport system substrate-binding protein|nr:ABC transporter substrate-binding protein [Verrucomicrobiae bacterium]
MMQQLVLLASDSSHLPLLTIFKESGVTKKYGFEIDLEIVGGRKAPTMAHRSKLIMAGEIDFVSGLHHETYRERSKGNRKLVYLAQTQNRWDDRLVGPKGLRSVDELRGKRIVCHSTAPCVTGNLKAILRQIGFKEDDIRVEAIESMSGNLTSYVDEVVAGKAAAALVDMPFDLYAENKGLKIVELPERPVIHNTTILTTTDYIRENRENVILFLKAIVDAIHFFKTKPEEVADILQKNLSRRYTLADRAYYVHLQREWAKLLLAKPYPLPAAIQNVFDLDVGHDPKMRGISPMEPWDLHYLREIDDSGFIDQLYAS